MRAAWPAVACALLVACGETRDADDATAVAAFPEAAWSAPSLARPDREQIEQYWLALQHLTRRQLYEEMARANETADWIEVAWLQLAIIARYYEHGIAAQMRQRDAWLARWPSHPMAARMPASLTALDRALAESPRRIALLVPLDGKAAMVGAAVRDGFLAAYYSAREQEGQSLPIIDIVNTAGHAMHDLAPKLREAGIDLVVGPLRKTAVRALCDIQKPLGFAVLALNQPDGCADPHRRIFRYSLDIDDEIDQLSRTMAWQGVERVMIITHQRPWSARALQRFERRWRALGRDVIASVEYTTQRELPAKMTAALHLRDSERRHAAAQRLLGRRLAFEPRRRRDIDGIVLLASPQQARTTRPTINFHYGRDISVYSVSRIHTGDETPRQYRDILGVEITEAPWLTDRFDIRSDILKQIPPPDGASLRLLGLGVEAYWLATRLAMWSQAGHALYGANGWLRLSSSERVFRRNLLWARVEENGVVAVRPRVRGGARAPARLDAEDPATGADAPAPDAPETRPAFPGS